MIYVDLNFPTSSMIFKTVIFPPELTKDLLGNCTKMEEKEKNLKFEALNQNESLLKCAAYFCPFV